MRDLFELWADKWLFGAEGGLSNHRWDDGGLTKYGISQKWHPMVDVRNLTWPQAKEIYWNEYWLLSGAHLLPTQVALCVADMAVMSAPNDAIKLLQEELEIKVDGVLGPKTLIAVNKRELGDLCAQYIARRIRRFQGHPDYGIAWKGWLARMIKLGVFAANVAKEFVKP